MNRPLGQPRPGDVEVGSRRAPGDPAFTVPSFEECVRRSMPEEAWRE